MLSQLVVEVVMLRGVVQEGLSLSTLKAAEVAIEVIRKLDRLVILKGLVQGLEDLVEGSSLLNGKVLQELPCSPSEASDHIQKSFCLTL